MVNQLLIIDVAESQLSKLLTISIPAPDRVRGGVS